MKIATTIMISDNMTMFCGLDIVRDQLSSIWQGDDPFNYIFPVFIMQIAISCLLTSAVKSLLEPIGQTSFISQMIGGIMVGPSCFGRTGLFKDKIFPPNSMYIFDNCQYFGSMFFLFLIGVKTDLTMLQRSGKKARLIGLFCFFCPLCLNLSVSKMVHHNIKLDNKVAESFDNVAHLMSLSSFHVVACFLDDLQLLSSEIGRLAMSVSMISGLFSWCSLFINYTTMTSIQAKKSNAFIWIILSCCFLVLVIAFVLRPIMFWIIRNTSEEKCIKEGYIFSILVMVLLSSLFGEIVGQHFLLGPIILGLAVPAGPPLGAAIEDRLECFVKSTLQVNVFEIQLQEFLILEFIVFISFLGKLLGSLLPALYCRVPYQDALWVGVIMNIHGVLDIEFWVWAVGLKLISERIYTCLVLSTVIVTGTISPSVKFLYNPSRRCTFRILACIYHNENVPTILNVLEASHPTTHVPICINMLHLIQLQGRASPLLVTHKNSQKEDSSNSFNPSSHIINAFKLYGKQNEGTVSVNSLTAISPYTTMHDDICSVASERRTSLIILPFHHHPSFSSTSHLPTSIRKVNQNVLKTAPCSVGLLVDRGSPQKAQASNKNGKSPYLVAVIFLCGEDDREALAYGARMGENSSVKLTVFRFSVRRENPDPASNADMLDNDSIDDFKKYNVGHENVVYREEEVKDSVGIVKVITSIEHSFDLLILGKDHDQNSSDLLRGLEEWSEFPELGLVGDMLSSSNSNCNGSILVVQQQSSVDSTLLDSPKYYFGELA
ncbi:hypothetical protein MKW98_025912 [Papaver atlanticum]|uniref:Cation/H+ exchanger domain-containing protein n=1 Tax=Papaver atlanticum TaxID=357466 RepID=A0AAD4SKQ8_9MAGN|nr:hypothetical protein MKW98_025912 [Papaver atlanticum]